jgi:septal ring factor EnvC (AmiA/AmiB activator)
LEAFSQPATADDRTRDLEALRVRVAELERSLAAVEAQAGDLLGSWAENRARSELQAARLEEAEAALRAATAQRDDSARRLAELEADLEERRARLRQRLLSIDRFAREGYLRLFLDVDRSADLLLAIRQLRLLAHRDASAVSDYRLVRDEVGEAQRDLERRVAEIELRVEQEVRARRELDAVLAEQQRLLRGLEQRRQRLELGVGELGRRETRLSRLVELLEDEGGTSLGKIAADELQGALDWPVSGTVVTEFGPRTDPVYGTTLPHNGIEIATLAGAEVRAVYPGRVLFAARFQDLGYTVVIEHSGRVLTLYAGLQTVQVAEGDVLPFQAVVGGASERLYFEVRRGKKAEDPRAWLR